MVLVVLGILIFVVFLLIIGILELVGNITGRQVLDWNNINAFMMILFVFVFFALIIYEYSIHKQFLLPEAASEHGCRTGCHDEKNLDGNTSCILYHAICLVLLLIQIQKKARTQSLLLPTQQQLGIHLDVYPSSSIDYTRSQRIEDVEEDHANRCWSRGSQD